MSPELNATHVLRMLPQAEAWPQETLARCTADLASIIDRTGESLAALVPWAVIGEWEWPTKSRVIEGHAVYYQGDPTKGPVRGVHWHGLPHVQLSQPGFPYVGLERGEPVLLNGQFPTVEGLCHLAADLRDILEELCDTDISRIQQRWGNMALPLPDFFENGEARALARLGPRIQGRITLYVKLSYRRRDGTGRTVWSIEESPQDYSFPAYCYWQLVQFIRDGHAWRVTRCTSCQARFLRVRRDPNNRPARFCSDACRRAWHNPRRGKASRKSTQGGRR
jgi:hypothetical protein